MDESNLTPREKKILELATKGGTDKELVILEQINELEDKFEATVKDIKESLPDLNELAKNMKGRDAVDPTDAELRALIRPLILPLIPEPVNGRDYVLTERDKQQIARSIKVPVIERTIERTEVIREQPIVTEVTKITNEIKEVAVSDTPDEVVQKVNQSKLLIGKERIDGLLEALGQMVANSVPITTNFFNGLRAKNLTIVGATARQQGDTVFLTVSGSGGGQVNSVVAGTNITVDSADPANPIVSATGGGSFSVMVPTGTIDGVNKVFVFTSAPSVIVVDNANTMNKTNKAPDSTANWSGTTTVTMLVAPTFNIFGY